MDIKSFFKLINRYKWLLILVPITAVTVTYFLVQNLPQQFKSNVQISTGLLDPTKAVITDQSVDLFKVNQQFSSITEKLIMKKSLDLLSYSLILHDLENPSKKFKKYSERVDSLNQEQRQDVIALYRDKLLSRSLLTVNDDKGKYKLFSIAASMGYMDWIIMKKLDVSHNDNSDYIDIAYTSENPDLSAFLVNTLATEFISSYTNDIHNNEANSNELLDSIVARKKAYMDSKNAALSSFKMSNGVINLPDQAGAVTSEITRYESQRTDISSKIDQDEAALSAINSKLRMGDSDNPGSTRNDNTALVNLRTQLQAANNYLVDHPTNIAGRRRLDSITRLLSAAREQNTNDNILDPRASKQSLVSQKNSFEISLASLKASFKTIDAQLTSLRSQYNKMMPYDANIQNMQREAELATKEYTDALDGYNKSKNIQSVSGFHMQIDQKGMPGNPEPSKRILYLAGAGIGSFALCLAFLLAVFALDNSVTTLRQLERATKAKSIGGLNTISGNERNIREIWNDKSGNQNYEIYRDLLRALRFEISNQMDAENKKILGITSLVTGEGKTLIAYGLAYAFAMTGKKILLIADELPVVKSDSKSLAKSQNFDTFLIKKEINTEDLITVLNKNMVQSSLLESQSFKSLQAGFDSLRADFDMVIIDVNSLHNMNIAKEWLLFTEMNVAVFSYGRTMGENDHELANYIKNKPGFIGWIMNKMELPKK
jgi:uncharacterized protein involved in exopolysaccharide biosynthesis